MFQQLLLALVLSSVTVVLHALGTVYVAMPGAGIWRRNAELPVSARPVLAITRLVSFLLILHLLEAAAWAAAFSVAGVFRNYETSFYYSLTSYTTVGYGDVLPTTSRRLLGPIESTVGILMLGWSTGIIVAAVQRLYNSRRQQ